MDYKNVLTKIAEVRGKISNLFETIEGYQRQIGEIKDNAIGFVKEDVEAYKFRIKELKQVKKDIETAWVVNMNFECRRKTKTESDKGIIYKVLFRTADGHTLTLASLSSDIFQGYTIGEKITVEISNPQSTLELPVEDIEKWSTCSLNYHLN